MKKNSSKKRFCGTIIVLLLGFTSPALAKDDNRQTTSYQYPQSQTLKPLSIWNQAITTDKHGKVVKRSYFQYGPDNKVLAPGSLWNNVITEKENK